MNILKSCAVITCDEIVDSVEIVLLISFNDQNATYKLIIIFCTQFYQ